MIDQVIRLALVELEYPTVVGNVALSERAFDLFQIYDFAMLGVDSSIIDFHRIQIRQIGCVKRLLS